jgi:hypothetical protein
MRADRLVRVGETGGNGAPENACELAQALII